jgi:hypothetical protein
MADEDFRREQWDHRFDAHVAPINALVDRLSDPGGREWMPYVAPMHGGVDATVLSLLRDPRPATQRRKGSGFLCIENDDRIAEQQWHRFVEADIDFRDSCSGTPIPGTRRARRPPGSSRRASTRSHDWSPSRPPCRW